MPTKSASLHLNFGMYFMGIILAGIGILVISCLSRDELEKNHFPVKEQESSCIQKTDFKELGIFSSNAISLPKENSNHEFLNTSMCDGIFYLNFYNSDRGSIDSYELTSGKMNRNIYFMPDSVDASAIKVAFHEDTLYCLDQNNVLWKSTSDMTLRIFDFNAQLSRRKLSVDPSTLGFGLSIINDSLLLLPLQIDPYSEGWLKPYGYPMSVVLNLRTLELDVTGILYPKHYHKFDYGLLRPINQILVGNSILYNPHAQDEIWEYDLAKDTILRHPFRSIYQEKEIAPLHFKSTPKTKDLLWKHADLSGEYLQLIYDPVNQVYYRFFKHFRPEKGADGYFTTYQQDIISVIVADKHFNTLAEYILPEPCFFIYIIAQYPEGIIINNGPLFGDQNNHINLRAISYAFP